MTHHEWNQGSFPEIDTELLNGILAAQAIERARAPIAYQTDTMESAGVVACRSLFDVTVEKDHYMDTLIAEGYAKPILSRAWRVGGMVIESAASAEARERGDREWRRMYHRQDNCDLDLALLERGMRRIENGEWAIAPRGLGEVTWDVLAETIERFRVTNDGEPIERWDAKIHPRLGLTFTSEATRLAAAEELRQKYLSRDAA